MKLLLGHPSMTALTLNQKAKYYDQTPVMQAVSLNRLKPLALLVADPRVDLDTTDNEGKSLEEVASRRREGGERIEYILQNTIPSFIYEYNKYYSD